MVWLQELPSSLGQQEKQQWHRGEERDGDVSLNTEGILTCFEDFKKATRSSQDVVRYERGIAAMP